MIRLVRWPIGTTPFASTCRLCVLCGFNCVFLGDVWLTTNIRIIAAEDRVDLGASGRGWVSSDNHGDRLGTVTAGAGATTLGIH